MGALATLSARAHVGLPILAVEYLNDNRKISDAQAKLANAGCAA
jgi:hypothetical protein